MCNMAASCLEISQCSLSVNISTLTREQVEPRLILEQPLILQKSTREAFAQQHLQLSPYILVVVLQYLHRRADVGVLFQIISAITLRAVPLKWNSTMIKRRPVVCMSPSGVGGGEDSLWSGMCNLWPGSAPVSSSPPQSFLLTCSRRCDSSSRHGPAKTHFHPSPQCI